MSEERSAVKVVGVFAPEDDETAAMHFVVLRDEAGRRMRVFVGLPEAQALAFGLDGLPPDRPSTYGATLACLATAGAEVEEACIYDLRNETFYAQVGLRVGEQASLVDMRPSDALNLAVRARCPVFVREEVWEAAQKSESAFLETMAEDESPDSPPTELGSPDEISAELARLYAEDQADRTPPSGEIDWNAVAPRDAARLARIKTLCRSQALRTGRDYFHAAMILQHAHEPDDYLLAHELCVVAASQGVRQAKWLAAASEDRFLMSLNRPQRFGTQYRIDQPTGRWSLYELASDLPDSVRRALNVPALSKAKAHVQTMNAKVVPSDSSHV